MFDTVPIYSFQVQRGKHKFMARRFLDDVNSCQKISEIKLKIYLNIHFNNFLRDISRWIFCSFEFSVLASNLLSIDSCFPTVDGNQKSGINSPVDGNGMVEIPKIYDRFILYIQTVVGWEWDFWIINTTSWWFQPLWKILVKLDHFPR